MKKIFFLLVFAFIISVSLFAQQGLVSGPMLGPIELRDAKVWIEVAPEVKSASIQFNAKGSTKHRTITYKGELGKDFNPITFTLGGLEPKTTYQYKILVNGKVVNASGEFTTKELWQYRTPVPDFSFLTGSCAYFNQPVYDRPGKPYGGDSSIFESMAKENSKFMVWLGDAWYTREVDYFSDWGMWYRASHDRAQPVMKNFLKAMPQIATWDDHDYGPNNIGKNFILKETSREIFKTYFCNPSYGENGQGIYTMLSYGDADIFITDDRWWRYPDEVADSIDGKPNYEKTMLGAQQMEWLKNSLLYSNAAFKIIVVGTQVLNPVSPYEVWWKYSAEYNDFMNFLKQYKIDGVVFLTGDRHHSSVIKVNRPDAYPLYDITVSPLTSGTYPFGGKEKDNPYRLIGIAEKQNYGKFSFSGKRGERKLKIEFLGIKGEKIEEFTISEKELKTSR